MKEDNWNDYEPVVEAQGKLKDFPAGSFREDDGTVDEFIDGSQQDSEPPQPYFSDDLVEQYAFFRKHIHKPKRVFYPCCNLDVSPLRGFPDSEVVLMDNEKGLEEIMRQGRISQFVSGDVLAYNPHSPFDLVIALNPSLSSKDLTKHLSRKGYVLANNWHNNASQLLEDINFEGIGTIDRNEKGIYLARGDFSKLEPNQFATYFYVFRKIGDK